MALSLSECGYIVHFLSLRGDFVFSFCDDDYTRTSIAERLCGSLPLVSRRRLVFFLVCCGFAGISFLLAARFAWPRKRYELLGEVFLIFYGGGDRLLSVCLSLICVLYT